MPTPPPPEALPLDPLMALAAQLSQAPAPGLGAARGGTLQQPWAPGAHRLSPLLSAQEWQALCEVWAAPAPGVATAPQPLPA